MFHLSFSKYEKICLLVPNSDLRIFPICRKWKFQRHWNNLRSVYHMECWKLWSKPGISMWLFQSWNVPAGSIISTAPQMLSTPFLLICHWRTNPFINYVCRTVNSQMPLASYGARSLPSDMVEMWLWFTPHQFFEQLVQAERNIDILF